MKVKVKTTEKPSKAFETVKAAYQSASKAHVSVGIHGDTERYDGGQTVAQIYAAHEHGAPSVGLPQRATMAPTVDRNTALYQRLLSTAFDQAQEGVIPIETGLGRLGLKVQADIKNAIVQIDSPPLSAMRIEQKKARAGSTLKPGQPIRGATVDGETIDTGNPLIDTGQMINSVTFKVNT